MFADGKGLSQLPTPVKVFIVSYEVLIAAGLLLSLWIVLKSPMLSGQESKSMVQTLEDMEKSGMSREELEAAKDANFYERMLKRAHIHHLGHILMVFSVAGIYAFTREKNNVKTSVIIWTTISTLLHTLAFLVYSRALLIIFGSLYGVLMAYMLIVILIDCYKPVRA